MYVDGPGARECAAIPHHTSSAIAALRREKRKKSCCGGLSGRHRWPPPVPHTRPKTHRQWDDASAHLSLRPPRRYNSLFTVPLNYSPIPDTADWLRPSLPFALILPFPPLS